jgi:hypothetical protein
MVAYFGQKTSSYISNQRGVCSGLQIVDEDPSPGCSPVEISRQRLDVDDF